MLAGEVTNYILDASFLLAHLLPDERIPQVDRVFQDYQKGKVNFLTSYILPLEVVNGLKYALISKRLASKQADKLIQDFQNYPIQFPDLDLEKTLKLSMEQNITVYDASYLYLARQYNLPLLSLDKKLQKLSQKT